MMMEVDPPVSASAEAVQRIRTRIELGEHSIINVRASTVKIWWLGSLARQTFHPGARLVVCQ